MTQDFFALFGLPKRYALDQSALDAAFREVQARVHPDKFTQASDTERRLALQWATLANEAYQTLRKPLSRAKYLCEQGGVDVGIESNTAMPAAFLMQQMEWREELAEARSSGDGPALDALERRLRQARKTEESELGRLIDEAADLQGASQHVRRLMFIEKFASEVGDALEDVQA